MLHGERALVGGVASDVLRPEPLPRFRTLKWHPVRLLSALRSKAYYNAKKRAVDALAAEELRRRIAARHPIAAVHTWSGDCLKTLRAARAAEIPSILEIPTWHRHKGKNLPDRLTMTEREIAARGGFAGWKERLPISRQETLEEYRLADLILVLSEKAEETFLQAGIAPEKLFRHQRGVDPDRFRPAETVCETFRVVFVGALIPRKGVHHLLAAWKALNLPNAELVLAGTVHEEIRPLLADVGPTARVTVRGFVRDIASVYRDAALHVLPSECEGSAKCTYEAAACGLPQITTREAGDVVVNGETGIIIPPNNVDALCDALRTLHADRALCARLGTAARQRVLDRFTWAHFDASLRRAYARLGITLGEP
jgi:glycosyltransferase involved in cell wall biosynthesis